MDPSTSARGVSETTTEHGQEKYLPERVERTGVALCLSGGGFRAALFHLGALRRLNELGVLSRVTTISSVSGGSILAAHLADRLSPWPSEGKPFMMWEEEIAQPFREFVQQDLRTGAILQRALPWNWFRSSTGVRALEKRYEERVTRLRLSQLPEHPQFRFCATDMAYGANWVFERSRVGDYRAGYASPPPDWPVARAVAASSCFPPIFNPLPIDLKPSDLKGGSDGDGPVRDARIRGLRLTDGGNYDNLGLEPVWKSHAHVLVSDGGATFDFTGDKNLLWRLNRYVEIASNQALAMRKRWLISNYIKGVLRGTYWGIGSAVRNYWKDVEGYPVDLVDDFISEVRTDMDAFSPAEIAILENHGYLLADAAVRHHCPELVASSAPDPRIPHPEAMDRAFVEQALKRSHARKLLGRG